MFFYVFRFSFSESYDCVTTTAQRFIPCFPVKRRPKTTPFCRQLTTKAFIHILQLIFAEIGTSIQDAGSNCNQAGCSKCQKVKRNQKKKLKLIHAYTAIPNARVKTTC